MNLKEYWECTLKALTWEDGKGPTSIVDDGGDMTLMLIEGVKWEKAYKENGSLPDPSKAESEDEKALLEYLKLLI